MPSKPQGRSYKMGPRAAHQAKQGQYMENRYAFTQNMLGQYVILVDPPDEDDLETGPNVRIFHPIPGRSAQVIDLTKLTEEEFVALRQIFMDAFEWALPTVQQRDKAAADAFANGDDSYPRSYRQVPQLVYRKRLESEHGEGVQYGYENVPPVAEQPAEPAPPGDDGRALRGPGDDVAEQHAAGGEPEDDGAASDQPEGVRPVGGARPPSVRLPPPHAG